jgi:hypothetical protein
MKPNVHAWKLGVMTCIAAGALVVNSTFAPINAKAHQLSKDEKGKESNVFLSRDGDLARGSDMEIVKGTHKVTLDVTDLNARGFQLSAFVETGSAADLCLATYNTSSQAEVLTPILCTGAEYRGKRGLHLLTNLDARPRDNFEVVVTVYQHNAQYYGAPVPWNIPCPKCEHGLARPASLAELTLQVAPMPTLASGSAVPPVQGFPVGVDVHGVECT